jgi:hypothetical protein
MVNVTNSFLDTRGKVAHFAKGREGDGPPVNFAKVPAAAGILARATTYGNSDVNAPIFLERNQPECWKPHRG